MNIRTITAGTLAAGLLAATPALATPPPCQILDEQPDTAFSVSAVMAADADIDGGDQVGIVDIQADWNAAYFRTGFGDLDLRLVYQGISLGDASDAGVPDRVGRIVADVGLVQRYENGFSGMLRLRPGFYTDFESIGGDSLKIPIMLAGVQTFSPWLSGLVGFEYRAGFDRAIFPHAWLAWEAADNWRVEAGVPTSRVIYSFTREWSVYGIVDWQDNDYEVDSAGHTGTMTFEDIRIGVGLSHLLLDQLQFTLEAGTLTGRNLKFEDEIVDRNIEGGLYLSAGVGGTF